jgi:hypothetical protein
MIYIKHTPSWRLKVCSLGVFFQENDMPISKIGQDLKYCIWDKSAPNWALQTFFTKCLQNSCSPAMLTKYFAEIRMTYKFFQISVSTSLRQFLVHYQPPILHRDYNPVLPFDHHDPITVAQDAEWVLVWPQMWRKKFLLESNSWYPFRVIYHAI